MSLALARALLAALSAAGCGARPLEEQKTRLRITNGCRHDPVWIAHQASAHIGPGKQNVRIEPQKSHDFEVHDDLVGMRYWPKVGCDRDGKDCTVGESGGIERACEAAEVGCAPPVDTKLEADFGLGGQDLVDINLVDGFTLPFKLEMDQRCETGFGSRNATKGSGHAPKVIDCSRLSFEACPAHEDLGAAGSSVDLRLAHPITGNTVGCYSPCGKLTLTQWGNPPRGAPDDPVASPYCCPTQLGENTSDCSEGVVARTRYVRAVHRECSAVYGHAYDDKAGLLKCPSTTRYHLTFYCLPASAAKRAHTKPGEAGGDLPPSRWAAWLPRAPSQVPSSSATGRSPQQPAHREHAPHGPKTRERPPPAEREGRAEHVTTEEHSTERPPAEREGRAERVRKDEHSTQRPPPAEKEGRARRASTDGQPTERPQPAEKEGHTEPASTDEQPTERPPPTEKEGHAKRASTDEQPTEWPPPTEKEGRAGRASTDEQPTERPPPAEKEGHVEPVSKEDQPTRLRISNGCAREPIWIAHEAGNGAGPDAQNIKIGPLKSHDFKVYDGLTGTRYWPKMRCGSDGNKCALGDSGGPKEVCHTKHGCAPPIDTKFEGTFGQDGVDWVDISLVDGFTLPFKFEIKGECDAGFGDKKTSAVIDCSKLSFESCPSGEDMGAAGSNVSLRVTDPDTGRVVGCYSPCSKLTLGQWDNAAAKGRTPWSAEVAPYCCPTPPESPESCREGPVPSTKFVKAVHQMCPGVYGYAYDDGMGLIQCPADTKYEVTFYCPAADAFPPASTAESPSQESTPHKASHAMPSRSSATEGSTGAKPVIPASTESYKRQPTRLRITNACEHEPIWIAHEAGPGVGPDDQNVRIAPRSSHDFKAPDGLAGTRYWPKLDCDHRGDNCGIGESGGPEEICDTEAGCAPPVDTKFEASFGQDGEDWVDISLVDGFTLPFKLEMKGNCSAGFKDRVTSNVIDCSNLSVANCPVDEDLGAIGSNVSLHVANPHTGDVVGCYSPCSKMTLGQWDNMLAKGRQPWDHAAAPYCCPTPPVSPHACRHGVGAKSKFVEALHRMCPGVYGYAYDDGMGLLKCPSDTKYEVTFYCLGIGRHARRRAAAGARSGNHSASKEAGEGKSVPSRRRGAANATAEDEPGNATTSTTPEEKLEDHVFHEINARAAHAHGWTRSTTPSPSPRGSRDDDDNAEPEKKDKDEDARETGDTNSQPGDSWGRYDGEAGPDQDDEVDEDAEGREHTHARHRDAWGRYDGEAEPDKDEADEDAEGRQRTHARRRDTWGRGDGEAAPDQDEADEDAEGSDHTHAQHRHHHARWPPAPSPEKPSKRSPLRSGHRGDEGAVEMWTVRWRGGVRIRESKNFTSKMIGSKKYGDMFHARRAGNWVDLTDEPGSIVIAVHKHILLEKAEDPRAGDGEAEEVRGRRETRKEAKDNGFSSVFTKFDFRNADGGIDTGRFSISLPVAIGLVTSAAMASVAVLVTVLRAKVWPRLQLSSDEATLVRSLARYEVLRPNADEAAQ